MRHIRGTSRTGQIAPEQVPVAAYGPSGSKYQFRTTTLTNRETIVTPREGLVAFLIPKRSDIDTMIATQLSSFTFFIWYLTIFANFQSALVSSNDLVVRRKKDSAGILWLVGTVVDFFGFYRGCRDYRKCENSGSGNLFRTSVEWIFGCFLTLNSQMDPSALLYVYWDVLLVDSSHCINFLDTDSQEKY